MTPIIFDLDGTLVESAAAICDVANRLLGELELPLMDRAETRGNIGNGVRFFLTKTLEARQGAYDPATFEARLARFEEIYADAPGTANVPFQGVEDLLAALQARGTPMGICTNKPEGPTRAVVAAHGWDIYFKVIIAGDTLAERKPHPLPLITAMERLGKERPIYVGDSEVDAATAKAAGFPFVLFSEGYRKASIEELSPTASFSDYASLLPLLDDLTARA